MPISYDELFSTYSIVARDRETGQIGVGVATHQLAVGRMVPWLSPGLGAVASQSLVNMSFGPTALAMLRANVSADRIIDALVSSDPDAYRRQVGVVDVHGNAAAYTGEGCIPEAGHYVGDGYAVQANLMRYSMVIQKMRAAYEGHQGDLASAIMAALQAAQKVGGDLRGKQSSAIKIVSGNRATPEWESVYDLRVDDHPDPINELARLVAIRRGQLISDEGYALLEQGDVQGALARWKDARDSAPDQLEIPFWQAIALADKNPDHLSMSLAARIMALVMDDKEHGEYWVELIRRLDEVNLIERDNAAEELLAALEDAMG